MLKCVPMYNSDTESVQLDLNSVWWQYDFKKLQLKFQLFKDINIWQCNCKKLQLKCHLFKAHLLFAAHHPQ